ncbi:hypothetical protein MMC12_008117 [Toensbergia leucococca]|nr:hypothetical protein [Toensbergia leucococca]
MATAQPRHSARRSFAGKDILTRMLQLEKQTKDRRAPPTAPTLTSSKTSPSLPTLFSQGTSVPDLAAQTLPHRPSITHRSQTLPSLSIKTSLPDGTNMPKSSSMPEELGSPDSEICQSPSWSDFGGNKRKKEKKKLEKEKKELERRLKKEEDKQKIASTKVAKRLNKPPPAAMDTQRMPTALKRLSNTSSILSQPQSQDNSRRSSMEMRRSSATSFTLKDVFSQSGSANSNKSSDTSPMDYRPVVSEVAPQLGRLSGIEFSPRNTLMNIHRPSLSKGEEEYEDDLVKFAYGLEGKSIADLNHGSFMSNAKDIQNFMPPPQIQQLDTPPPSRSNTVIDLTLDGQESINMTEQPVPFNRRRSSEEGKTHGKRDGSVGGYRYPNFSASQAEEVTKDGVKSPSTVDDFRRVLQTSPRKDHGGSHWDSSPSTYDLSPLHTRSSVDRNSYVYKQRMFEQQRSISGYQDEIAIEDAYGSATGFDALQFEKQKWPPTPNDSNESLERRTKSLSAQNEINYAGQHIVNDSERERSPIHLAGSQTSLDRGRTNVPSIIKANRLTGNRRRQESSNASSPLISPKTVTFDIQPSSPSFPASLPSTYSSDNMALSSKDFKAEHKFEDLKTAPAESSKAPENTSNGNSVTAESINSGKTVREHSRTRTASSQLLNEDLPTRPMPRSSTTPNILTTKERPKTATEDVSSSKPSLISKYNTGITAEMTDPVSLTRQTSLKRPRSNPQLQISTIAPQLPSFDFLPQLKHQALVKPKRTSQTPASLTTSPDILPSSQFPVPSSTAKLIDPCPQQDLHVPPKSPLRSSHQTHTTSLLRPDGASRRRTTSPASSLSTTSSSATSGLDVKPLAKLFVICCKCKRWHDLPSKVYEAMAVPKKLSREGSEVLKARMGEANGVVVGGGGGGGGKSVGVGVEEAVAVEGRLETMVECSWCAHAMTTWCCAGWTTVVYLHERHH